MGLGFINISKDWLIGLYLVFGGCCSNVITLETILNIQNKSGRLITLIQFIFIACEGLIRNIQFKNPLKNYGFPITLKQRQVPISKWILMVILFFGSSILNNIVFEYHISIPIHIIFRSASIIVNMIMSWLILKKKYTIQQISAIITVTVGLIITTISTATINETENEKHKTSLKEYIIGITLMVIASIIGALMGIYQEYIFKKYPNSWKECLFYNHLLSIPIFVIFTKQIKEQFILFQSSPIREIGYYIPFLPQVYQKYIFREYGFSLVSVY